MNPRRLLLALSLAGNVVLVVLAGRALTVRSAPNSPVVVAETNAPAPAASTKVARSRTREARPAIPSPTAASPASSDFRWAAVESADFPAYLQNLRAIGVPEDIVRDLVRAEVSHRYRPRQVALWQTARRSTNYWENGMTVWEFNQPTPQVHRQLKGLEREMNAEMKALLGEDALFDDNPLNKFFASLAPDVRRQIMALDEARDRKHEQFDMGSAFYDEEAHRARKLADREYYAALAKIVPPDQYEAFALRYSDTASTLRHELHGFTPTEDEFKALYRLRAARDAAEPLDVPDSERKPADLQHKQKAMKEALLAALGPERAKEFEVLQNHNLHSLIESGVPAADFVRMDAMNKSLGAAATKLRDNTALTAAQRNAAHEALRLELERELKQLIGERRANYFLSSQGPNYFGEIARKPKEVKP